MKSKSKKIILLYVKNNKKNQKPVTDQTRNNREKTNEKIRILGSKYFIIKRIFEQLNLKRDDIFEFGKILEQEYKDLKKGIYLQNQKRRMKDALYCWYAEFFFEELCIPNSIILKRLINNSQKIANLNYKYITKSHCTQEIINKTETNEDILNTANEINDSIFKHMKANQEIDSFENSNISNDSSKSNTLGLDSNNDYYNLLNI